MRCSNKLLWNGNMERVEYKVYDIFPLFAGLAANEFDAVGLFESYGSPPLPEKKTRPTRRWQVRALAHGLRSVREQQSPLVGWSLICPGGDSYCPRFIHKQRIIVALLHFSKLVCIIARFLNYCNYFSISAFLAAFPMYTVRP